MILLNQESIIVVNVESLCLVDSYPK